MIGRPPGNAAWPGTKARPGTIPGSPHRHFSDIVELIDGADALSDGQKDLAKRIFEEVAVSEAKVHGSSIEKVHFHEVGAIDSIVDIVGAAIGFDLLGAEQIISSDLQLIWV